MILRREWIEAAYAHPGFDTTALELFALIVVTASKEVVSVVNAASNPASQLAFLHSSPI